MFGDDQDHRRNLNMADTNGNVAPAHLAAYQGVLVSVAILPALRAAGDQFRAEGHTFGIILPDGGYRSLATQQDEHDHPADHNISAAMAKRLADVGKSTHGFGRAVDVFSNTTQANIDRIMAAHGFRHPFSWDVPHWEWGNALVAADVSSIPLTPSKELQDMDYDYIHDAANKNWALIHPVHIPGGYVTTKTVTTAEQWNLATGVAAREVDAVEWAKALAGAKALADLAVAAAPSAGTVGLPADAFQGVIDAVNALGVKIDAIKTPTKIEATLS